MRRFNILMFFFLISVTMHAQFINNGATVTIQSGATLRVETDFINNSGTVTNLGTLEVKDDFTNAATFTADPGSTVRFIGSDPSLVTSGGATFGNVEMAKTTNNIELQDAMIVAGQINFASDNNKVVIGDHNLTLTTSGSITSADDNEYVATTGTGTLIKPVSGNGTIAHEIGDASNYTPLSSAVTGTGYTAATLAAKVYTTGTQAKYGEATDLISREWNVVSNGIADYNNNMTGTYVDAGDITGTETLIKGSTYTTDWSFAGSAGDAVANTVTASAGLNNNNVKFSGQNFFGKANLKAYLAGALPSGTTMTTTLNTNSLIPLQTPYNVAPFNAPVVTAPSIPATATDWILVEVRDASTPTTLVSQTSAFLLSDGTIVNMDGQPLRLKNAVATAHIALKHRNHLGIRTATAMDLVTPPTLKNFSLGTSEAYTDGAISSNANMKQIGSVYALWNGDVNNDGFVRYSSGFIPPSTVIPSDALLILNQLGNLPAGQLSIYSKGDINLDRYTRYSSGFIPPSTVIPSDALLILSALGNLPAGQLKMHN